MVIYNFSTQRAVNFLRCSAVITFVTELHRTLYCRWFIIITSVVCCHHYLEYFLDSFMVRSAWRSWLLQRRVWYWLAQPHLHEPQNKDEDTKSPSFVLHGNVASSSSKWTTSWSYLGKRKVETFVFTSMMAGVLMWQWSCNTSLRPISPFTLPVSSLHSSWSVCIILQAQKQSMHPILLPDLVCGAGI